MDFISNDIFKVDVFLYFLMQKKVSAFIMKCISVLDGSMYLKRKIQE